LTPSTIGIVPTPSRMPQATAFELRNPLASLPPTDPVAVVS